MTPRKDGEETMKQQQLKNQQRRIIVELPCTWHDKAFRRAILDFEVVDDIVYDEVSDYYYIENIPDYETQKYAKDVTGPSGLLLEIPPGKPRCPETILQKNRRLWLAQNDGNVNVYVDDETITQRDIELFKKRSNLMKIKTQNAVTNNVKYYEGQASILRCPDNNDGDNDDDDAQQKKEDKMVKEFFVTALRNMVSKKNEKGDFEDAIGHFLFHPDCCCEHRHQQHYQVKFTQAGHVIGYTQGVELRFGIVWTTGNEVCRGPPADIRSLIYHSDATNFRETTLHTTVVNDNFEYAVGMKVAIAVYTNNETSLTKSEASLAPCVAKDTIQGVLSWFLGPPSFLFKNCFPKKQSNIDLIITTGEITHVGNDHVEYNINTVGGHAGALVVMYDHNHPKDHGKAIAVHAGHSNALGANIGFKLTGMSFEDNDD